jgi:uncharacterized protein (TIGR02300 family)
MHPSPDVRGQRPHRPRPLGNNVTKPELGTKRLCAGCNAKFYDLLKSPIVCPMCEAVFVVPKAAPSRPRRGFEPMAQVVPVVAAPAIVAKDDEASVTGENADGEKDAEGGVAMLEIDED